MSFGPCRSLIYLASFGFHEQLRIPGSSLPSIPGEFVECTGMESSPIEIACRSGSLQFEKQYSLEDHSISNIMSAFQAIDSHTSASIVHQHYSHSVACMHDLHDATPRIIGNSIDLGWILGPPTGGSGGFRSQTSEFEAFHRERRIMPKERFGRGRTGVGGRYCIINSGAVFVMTNRQAEKCQTLITRT